MQVISNYNYKTVNPVVGDDINTIRNILAEHSNTTYLDVFNIGIRLALRISDLLALKYDDLFEGGEIKDYILIKEGKTAHLKNKPPRKVVLTDSTKKLILDRRLKNPNDVYLFQSNYKNVKAVKPLSRQTVWSTLSDAGNKVGLHLGTHSLRKSLASHMYSNGVAVEKISRFLNHSSTAVTLLYIGITQQTVDDLYEYTL